jgi:hypothetical protein
MECAYCSREMNRSQRSFLANQFCTKCLAERLEVSGAVDLRDNHRIIELENGYHKIEIIDPTKLFKAVRT